MKRTASLILVGLFLWVTACTSYRQIQPADIADYGKVRVTTTDGERRVLYDPTIETDAIKGRRQGDEAAFNIPLEVVSTIEESYVSTDKSVALGLGLLLVAATVVGFYALSQWEGISPLGSAY